MANKTARVAWALLRYGQHEASMTMSVSLADIATRIDMLEMRCGRCGRAGRRRVSRLIEQHGGSMRLPDLRAELT